MYIHLVMYCISSQCLPLCEQTQKQALYSQTLYIILLILVTLSFVLSENHVLLCAFALFLPLPWRALFMSRAEVLIKVFAYSLRGGKCKTHSTIEVRIHAPRCFLAEHVFSVEPSGTLPSSLKRLHYWSWTVKPNACRCGSSQQGYTSRQAYSHHKAFPLRKQRTFCFVCGFGWLC